MSTTQKNTQNASAINNGISLEIQIKYFDENLESSYPPPPTPISPSYLRIIFSTQNFSKYSNEHSNIFKLLWSLQKRLIFFSTSGRFFFVMDCANYYLYAISKTVLNLYFFAFNLESQPSRPRMYR